MKSGRVSERVRSRAARFLLLRSNGHIQTGTVEDGLPAKQMQQTLGVREDGCQKLQGFSVDSSLRSKRQFSIHSNCAQVSLFSFPLFSSLPLPLG